MSDDDLYTLWQTYHPTAAWQWWCLGVVAYLAVTGRAAWRYARRWRAWMKVPDYHYATIHPEYAKDAEQTYKRLYPCGVRPVCILPCVPATAAVLVCWATFQVVKAIVSVIPKAAATLFRPTYTTPKSERELSLERMRKMPWPLPSSRQCGNCKKYQNTKRYKGLHWCKAGHTCLGATQAACQDAYEPKDAPLPDGQCCGRCDRWRRASESCILDKRYCRHLPESGKGCGDFTANIHAADTLDTSPTVTDTDPTDADLEIEEEAAPPPRLCHDCAHTEWLIDDANSLGIRRRRLWCLRNKGFVMERSGCPHHTVKPKRADSGLKPQSGERMDDWGVRVGENVWTAKVEARTARKNTEGLAATLQEIKEAVGKLASPTVTDADPTDADLEIEEASDVPGRLHRSLESWLGELQSGLAWLSGQVVTKFDASDATLQEIKEALRVTKEQVIYTATRAGRIPELMNRMNRSEPPSAADNARAFMAEWQYSQGATWPLAKDIAKAVVEAMDERGAAHSPVSTSLFSQDERFVSPSVDLSAFATWDVATKNLNVKLDMPPPAPPRKCEDCKHCPPKPEDGKLGRCSLRDGSADGWYRLAWYAGGESAMACTDLFAPREPTLPEGQCCGKCKSYGANGLCESSGEPLNYEPDQGRHCPRFVPGATPLLCTSCLHCPEGLPDDTDDWPCYTKCDLGYNVVVDKDQLRPRNGIALGCHEYDPRPSTPKTCGSCAKNHENFGDCHHSDFSDGNPPSDATCWSTE